MHQTLRTAALALILALASCAPPAFAQSRINNLVSGSASTTTTAQTTLIAAPVTRRLYVTSVQCGRSDTGTSAISLQLNDDALTTLVIPNTGGGGGSNVVFPAPLTVASGTALKFTASAGVSTLYCSAQGYQDN
jgi:hypothetical protein